ncbi:hypothetical protein ACFO0M_03000 [Micromonospora mangrovi]|uniref:DUF2092 domain-containing protein n=2 Tax=Micromonospora TaxID=1873 RepID=A0AAU7M0K2_9ACTN
MGALVALLVLVGAAVVAVSTAWKPESREQVAARLTDTGRRLKEAGTARVAFTSEMKPQLGGRKVTLQGTSLVKFGDRPSWETTYAQIAATGHPTLQAKGVHLDDDTYYTSPSIVAEDGRPWFDSHTLADWGSGFSDPDTGVADLMIWQRFLDDVSEGIAANGETDKLPDLKGAPHEYQFRCTPGSDVFCPPPFRTSLDLVFNRVVPPLFSVWIDDAGRLRKLEVETSVLYVDDGRGSDDGFTHPQDEWEIRTSFTLDQFGTPVTVTAPPADQITQSREVKLKASA